jgi:hypothetical protein
VCRVSNEVVLQRVVIAVTAVVRAGIEGLVPPITTPP